MRDKENKMQYMLDTANLDQISQCLDIYPIEGVTTNPTILKEEGSVPLRERLLDIRALCGSKRLVATKGIGAGGLPRVPDGRVHTITLA